MAAPQEAVGIGSAGIENRIAERYSWRRGAGDATFGDDAYQSNGHRLHVTDEKASPLTFVALFPYIEEPDPELPVATAPVAMSICCWPWPTWVRTDRCTRAQRLQG